MSYFCKQFLCLLCQFAVIRKDIVNLLFFSPFDDCIIRFVSTFIKAVMYGAY